MPAWADGSGAHRHQPNTLQGTRTTVSPTRCGAVASIFLSAPPVWRMKSPTRGQTGPPAAPGHVPAVTAALIAVGEMMTLLAV
jgi:hypothetical protein